MLKYNKINKNKNRGGKNMLNAKMDLDSIAKITGLSMEEIEKLK